MKKLLICMFTLLSVQSTLTMRIYVEPTQSEREVRALRNALNHARDFELEVDDALDELVNLYEEIDRANNNRPRDYIYSFNATLHFRIRHERGSGINSHYSGSTLTVDQVLQNRFRNQLTDEFINNFIQDFQRATPDEKLSRLERLIFGVEQIRVERYPHLVIVTPQRLSDEEFNRLVVWERQISPHAFEDDSTTVNSVISLPNSLVPTSSSGSNPYFLGAAIALPLVAIISYLCYTKKSKKESALKKDEKKKTISKVTKY